MIEKQILFPYGKIEETRDVAVLLGSVEILSYVLQCVFRFSIKIFFSRPIQERFNSSHEGIIKGPVKCTQLRLSIENVWHTVFVQRWIRKKIPLLTGAFFLKPSLT